jgi:hypothetical protein
MLENRLGRLIIAWLLVAYILAAGACSASKREERRGTSTKVGCASMSREPGSDRVVVLVDVWWYHKRGSVTNSETWMFIADMKSREVRFAGSYAPPSDPVGVETHPGVRTQVVGWHLGDVVLAFCPLKEGIGEEMQGAPFHYVQASMYGAFSEITSPPEGMTPVSLPPPSLPFDQPRASELEAGICRTVIINTDFIELQSRCMLPLRGEVICLCLSTTGAQDRGLVRFCADREDDPSFTILTGRRTCPTPLLIGIGKVESAWHIAFEGGSYRLESSEMIAPLRASLERAGTRSVLIRGPEEANPTAVRRAAQLASLAGAECANFEIFPSGGSLRATPSN